MQYKRQSIHIHVRREKHHYTCGRLDVEHSEVHVFSTDSTHQRDGRGASGSKAGVYPVSGSMHSSHAPKTIRDSAPVAQKPALVALSEGLLRATAGRGRR
jgi:hypothetical protein